METQQLVRVLMVVVVAVGSVRAEFFSLPGHDRRIVPLGDGDEWAVSCVVEKDHIYVTTARGALVDIDMGQEQPKRVQQRTWTADEDTGLHIQGDPAILGSVTHARDGSEEALWFLSDVHGVVSVSKGDFTKSRTIPVPHKVPRPNEAPTFYPLGGPSSASSSSTHPLVFLSVSEGSTTHILAIDTTDKSTSNVHSILLSGSLESAASIVMNDLLWIAHRTRDGHRLGLLLRAPIMDGESSVVGWWHMDDSDVEKDDTNKVLALVDPAQECGILATNTGLVVLVDLRLNHSLHEAVELQTICSTQLPLSSDYPRMPYGVVDTTARQLILAYPSTRDTKELHFYLMDLETLQVVARTQLSLCQEDCASLTVRAACFDTTKDRVFILSETLSTFPQLSVWDYRRSEVVMETVLSKGEWEPTALAVNAEETEAFISVANPPRWITVNLVTHKRVAGGAISSLQGSVVFAWADQGQYVFGGGNHVCNLALPVNPALSSPECVKVDVSLAGSQVRTPVQILHGISVADTIVLAGSVFSPSIRPVLVKYSRSQHQVVGDALDLSSETVVASGCHILGHVLSDQNTGIFLHSLDASGKNSTLSVVKLNEWKVHKALKLRTSVQAMAVDEDAGLLYLGGKEKVHVYHLEKWIANPRAIISDDNLPLTVRGEVLEVLWLHPGQCTLYAGYARDRFLNIPNRVTRMLEVSISSGINRLPQMAIQPTRASLALTSNRVFLAGSSHGRGWLGSWSVLTPPCCFSNVTCGEIAHCRLCESARHCRTEQMDCMVPAEAETPSCVSINNTCEDCLSMEGCGWCAFRDLSHCVPVTSMNDDKCDNWYITGTSSSCDARCTSHSSCSDCLMEYGCTWCAEDATCRFNASDDKKCGYRLEDMASCALVEATHRCAHATTCAACHSTTLCGWCDGVCQPIGPPCPGSTECPSCPTCDAHPDCSTCLAKEGCGWDWETGVCRCIDSVARVDPETGSVTFPVSFSRDACFGCSDMESCVICTLDERCGWCEDNGGVCRFGTMNSPFEDACTILWSFESCHQEVQCEEVQGCAPCVSRGCAWCDADDQCYHLRNDCETTPIEDATNCSVCAFSSCFDCARQDNCVWCGSMERCLLKGPDAAACPDPVEFNRYCTAGPASASPTPSIPAPSTPASPTPSASASPFTTPTGTTDTGTSSSMIGAVLGSLTAIALLAVAVYVMRRRTARRRRLWEGDGLDDVEMPRTRPWWRPMDRL